MKKYICIILIFILAVSTSSVSLCGSAANENSEAKLLAELGIFSESDFVSTEAKPYVTRSDAAKLFVKMTGMPPAYYNDIPFTDVTTDANASYISTAYKLGLVSGTSAVTYEPQGIITFAQSAKIILNILGYEPACIAAGGYPAGYLMYANKLGIFDGTDTSSENITYEQMSVIILNAMSAELALIETIGDTTEYKTYENTNLLSENFDIYIAEDVIITSDTYTNIYGYSGTGDSTVIANLEVYDASGFAGEVPVGSCCDIYYRQTSDGGKKQLLSAVCSEEFNETYSLLSKYIVSSDKTHVEYEDESGKVKKFKISPNACIVYNGQFASYRDGMFADSDELALTDNNGDGTADVVFVNKYTVIIADTVSASNSSVSDKLTGKSYRFEEEGSGYATVFYYGNEKTIFQEIEKNSVLSVLIPEKTDVEFAYKVYITDDVISGSVEAVNTSSGEITVSDKTYDCTEGVISQIKPGDSGTFFADKLGRIVSYTLGASSEYAFVNGFKSGTFGKLSLRMFTDDGTWLETDIADKLDFNSKSISKENLTSEPLLFKDASALIPQLVRYSLNSAGEIKSIETAEDYTSLRYTDDETNAIDNNIFRLSYSSAKSSYYQSGIATLFSVDTHVGADTRIIYVPDDLTDTSAYFVNSITDLVHNVSYTNVKAYNCGPSGEAEIVVLNNTTSGGSDIMLVTGITKTINASGDETERIRGFCFGYEVSFDTESADTVSDMLGAGTALKAGDVIVVRFNANDEIKSFRRAYESGVTAPGGVTSSGYFNSSADVTGDVVTYDDTRIVVDVGAVTASFMINSAPVYVYENADGRELSRLGSMGDIEKGDRVFIRLNYMKCLNIVVYK